MSSGPGWPAPAAAGWTWLAEPWGVPACFEASTSLAMRSEAPYLGDADALVHAMLLLAVEWAILYRLYRRRIFLSA